MSKEAILIGYSGHGYVVADILIANQFTLIGYCDIENKSKNPYNLTYFGCETDEAVKHLLTKHHVFLGVGDNNIRENIFKYLLQLEINCPFIVHNKAVVSPHVTIDSGSVVMAGAVINSGAEIGKAVICNSSSVIEHECIIGDYSHVAPGAVLAGNVSVGYNTFIGANAVVKQNVKIGSNVIIGAGSVVLKDVLDGTTVYGNPAKSKSYE